MLTVDGVPCHPVSTYLICKILTFIFEIKQSQAPQAQCEGKRVDYVITTWLQI